MNHNPTKQKGNDNDQKAYESNVSYIIKYMSKNWRNFI